MIVSYKYIIINGSDSFSVTIPVSSRYNRPLPAVGALKLVVENYPGCTRLSGRGMITVGI